MGFKWTGIADLLEAITQAELRDILVRIDRALNYLLNGAGAAGASEDEGDLFPIGAAKPKVGMIVGVVDGRVEPLDPTGEWQGDNLTGICTEIVEGRLARIKSEGIAWAHFENANVDALFLGASVWVSGSLAGRLTDDWPAGNTIHKYHVGYILEIAKPWKVKIRLAQFKQARQIVVEA